MDTLGMKILFIFVILTTSSTFGLTPVLFGKYLGKKIKMKQSTRKKWLSNASCFGAGVFMYVCFLGLLPEADMKFHQIMEEVAENGYPQVAAFPWPYLIVVCGFLFIFTIDKVVHSIEDSKQRKNSLLRKNKLIPLNSSLNKKDLVNGSLNSTEDVEGISHPAHDGHGVPSSLIILIALCMHAIFEGMAVGLQSSKENVFSFSIAIIIHESVMAFTFGLTVAKGAISRCKKVMYMLIFASSIPSGIAIGIALRGGSSYVTYIVSAIFEAIAPGIFIHVIFIEIIGSEFSDEQEHSEQDEHSQVHKGAWPGVLRILTKVLCIILGLLLILVVNLLTPHPQ